MQQESSKAYEIIKGFAHKCADTRTAAYLNLKSAHEECRKALAQKLLGNADIREVTTQD